MPSSLFRGERTVLRIFPMASMGICGARFWDRMKPPQFGDSALDLGPRISLQDMGQHSANTSFLEATSHIASCYIFTNPNIDVLSVLLSRCVQAPYISRRLSLSRQSKSLDRARDKTCSELFPHRLAGLSIPKVSDHPLHLRMTRPRGLIALIMSNSTIIPGSRTR